MELLWEFRDYQSDTKNVGWNTVRIIDDENLLIIEYILKALLAEEGVAQIHVYNATRHYVEEYNGVDGTGIIRQSIPRFKNVVKYWKRQINTFEMEEVSS